MSEQTEEEIDPSWWAAAFDSSSEPGDYQPLELLSQTFEASLKAPGVGDLQGRVLEALMLATSPMLVPENWLEPYTPAIQFGDRRSAIPSDLDSAQLALLARLAPLISQPSLKARVADIAWFYGNRGDVHLADLAIDAYRTTPLEPDAWFSGGHDSWRRAFELAKRRGASGQEAIADMGAALRARIVASDTGDGFMTVQLSELLRGSVPVDIDDARTMAEHLASLASTAARTNARLSRHLEREASTWFLKCSDTSAAHDCAARVADRYVQEADQRLASDALSGAMAAGMFLEKAITTIRGLPRRYREAKGLDTRLTELRDRLADSREATLESMTKVESDPVDLTDYVATARTQVSGKDKFEALASFSAFLPLTDAEQADRSARELLTGRITSMLGRATFSRDGRKVAASEGSGTQVSDAQVWSEVVRSFGMRISLFGMGAILPAQEVLTLEHQFSLSYVRDVISASPVVPPGHEGLWAVGLWHGLNGDYASAASVLVPQLEQLVRRHLKQNGVYTVLMDDTGVESEKSLGALLDLPEAIEVLGSGLALELRALLTEQEGPNLRNHVAHGLFSDAEAWSYNAVYAWWLALRIVVVPVWTMRAMTQPADGAQTTDEDATAP